ncbi:myo-inositol-1-monophosphatase [Pandoraea commovens]|uniref:Myo-inositol-1-monophosphatase n=2 Tax=Pandoraea commovens TaxID=2508289 RepID=A0A5E4RNT3_9BURK|nr:myo-inositol-1-monophosphatase [Pandoraea commovens]
MPDIDQRLAVAVCIVHEAARSALELFDARGRFALEEKGAREYVSEADRMIERRIREALAIDLSEDDVMGEEMGGKGSNAFWAIDPIDGTANFLRGSPLWGVSLGFVEDDEPVVGVIAYPSLGVTLSAARGRGVSRNGQSFERNIDFPSVHLAAVGDNARWPATEIAQVEYALRTSGWGLAEYRCATIGLGFAALGFVDGYLEKHTSIWDIAAGSVICREAGLGVHAHGTYDGGGQTIFAGTDALHAVVDRHLSRS